MNKRFETALIENLKGRIAEKKAADEDTALAFKKGLKGKVEQRVSLSADLSDVIRLAEQVAALEADPNFEYDV